MSRRKSKEREVKTTLGNAVYGEEYLVSGRLIRWMRYSPPVEEKVNDGLQSRIEED